mmetsp:Transcript_63543/g.187589  ORF Transcript_63543/g.187589 Transcript_63543/m.187589 type:complete len:383 (-) Transcript_63543:144-1292(-)
MVMPVRLLRAFPILALMSLPTPTFAFVQISQRSHLSKPSGLVRPGGAPLVRPVHAPTVTDPTGLNSDTSEVSTDGDNAGLAPVTASRRDILSGITILTASHAVSFFAGVPSALGASSADLGAAGSPIAIIGGGGRTGMEVAEALAGSEGKLHAVTMTRSGKDPFRIIKLPTEIRERLEHYPESVDVKDEAAVLAALKEINASGVVFAASASKQGGNARDVDDVGVGNVAKAAKSTGSRLILVSALAVDRPESKSYKVTNDMGGYVNKIMDAKLDGENKVRSVMGPGGDYIILRPGVLLSGKSKEGAADLELNQGDTVGGGLSRDELAGVVVGALKSGKKGVTVEVYRKRTTTKLQPEFVVPSGNELTASSYIGLFENAKSDL